MENIKEEPPKLSAQLKDYIETRIKLARYQAIDKGTSIIAGLAIEVFVLICIFLTFVFATLTLALFLGHVLDSYWMGFGCVAVLYLIIALVVARIKHKLLEPLVVNFLLKKIFK